VVRGEHHIQAGQDSVELTIAVRQGFGVRDFPKQLDTDLGGPVLADLHQFGRQVAGDHLDPARGAGMASLPLPAATSSTRSPGLISAAPTRMGPSSEMMSVTTAW
jgi:hypothetical protein